MKTEFFIINRKPSWNLTGYYEVILDVNYVSIVKREREREKERGATTERSTMFRCPWTEEASVNQLCSASSSASINLIHQKKQQYLVPYKITMQKKPNQPERIPKSPQRIPRDDNRINGWDEASLETNTDQSLVNQPINWGPLAKGAKFRHIYINRKSPERN